MSKINYIDKVAVNQNTSIPVENKCNSTDLNSLKNAVNQIGAYNTATVGTNAYQFKVNLEGTLSTGDVVNILFPTSTNTSNAQLSVNNGTNYYNLISKNNSNFTGKILSGQLYSFYFNGTSFVCLQDITMYATFGFNKNNVNQVFESDTYDNVITWINIYDPNYSKYIYLSSNTIYFTNLVDKVEVIGSIWMTQNQPNLQFNVNGDTNTIILYSQELNRYFINYNFAIDKSQPTTYFKISPYLAGTVYGDTMWTWLKVTITYKF